MTAINYNSQINTRDTIDVDLYLHDCDFYYGINKMNKINNMSKFLLYPGENRSYLFHSGRSIKNSSYSSLEIWGP